MARDIDITGDLTVDDIRYLKDRTWKLDEWERQGYTEECRAVREFDLAAYDAGDKPAEEDLEVLDEYDSWTKEMLVAEIDNRNKEIEEGPQLSKAGSKAELISRLRKDDADMDDLSA